MTIKTAPIKPTISIDELHKIDVRVGRIELVEEVNGSDKLVKLSVDFGDHKRQILAAIKQERASPKEIEGKQALFVVNLKPKKMMGEISEGMLFDIGYADEIVPVLAVPEKEVPNGDAMRVAVPLRLAGGRVDETLPGQTLELTSNLSQRQTKQTWPDNSI